MSCTSLHIQTQIRNPQKLKCDFQFSSDLKLFMLCMPITTRAHVCAHTHANTHTNTTGRFMGVIPLHQTGIYRLRATNGDVRKECTQFMGIPCRVTRSNASIVGQ